MPYLWAKQIINVLCSKACTGPGELTVPLIQIPQIVFISKTSLLSLVVGFRMCQLSCQVLAHEELTVLPGMKLCPIVHVTIPQTWAPSSGSLCFSIVIVNCKITSLKRSEQYMTNLSGGCSPERFQNIWKMEEILRAFSKWSLESSSAFHFVERENRDAAQLWGASKLCSKKTADS